MMYPNLIDLSMHSLQKRCKHPITVRAFLMMPVLCKRVLAKSIFFFSKVIEPKRSDGKHGDINSFWRVSIPTMIANNTRFL